MPAVGTAALIGSAIGAASAIITGGNVLKGALFGAVGGGIGGAISGAAGGAIGEAGSAAAGDAIGATASTAGAVGADAAASATQSLAQGLVADTAGTAAATGAGEAAGTAAAAGGDIAGGAAGSIGDVGTSIATVPAQMPAINADYFAANGGNTFGNGVATSTGVGDAAAGVASNASPGLVQQAMDWAKANPKLASAAVQGVGSTLQGIGTGVGNYMSVEQKAQLDLDNKEKLVQYYRDFVQNGSTGGKNVNLGIKAPTGPRALVRPGGAPVYNPNGGLNS